VLLAAKHGVACKARNQEPVEALRGQAQRIHGIAGLKSVRMKVGAIAAPRGCFAADLEQRQIQKAWEEEPR